MKLSKYSKSLIYSPVKERYSFNEIGDEAVLCVHEKTKTLILNETAKYVWKLMDGSNTLDDIMAKLCNDYDVDMNTAYKDIIKVLKVFEEMGILERQKACKA